jgi:hypothetical protein
VVQGSCARWPRSAAMLLTVPRARSCYVCRGCTHTAVHVAQAFDVCIHWFVCVGGQGAKFSEVVKLTDIFEGSIIRAMRR